MAKKNNSLKKIPGHPSYFRAEASGKIYFIKAIQGKTVRTACNTDKITHAKRFIEEEYLPKILNQTTSEKRKKRGVINPLLGELWEEMLIEKDNVDEYTAKRRVSCWRIDLEEYWGDKQGKDITASEVRKFEKWYQKEFPGKGFFTAKKYLTMFINWLHQSGYIAKKIDVTDLDPIISKKYKKAPVGYVLTKSELEDLKTCGNELVELAYWFSARMGMRKMEFLSLEIKAIDLKKRNVGFFGKGNRFRNVPIPKEFINILKTRIKFVEALGSSYIFPMKTEPSRHTSSQVWDKEWNKVKEEIKLNPKCRPHDLRHTFATNTARNNWNPIVACAVLGHNLKHYQETYVHLSPKDLLRMVDSLEEF